MGPVEASRGLVASSRCFLSYVEPVLPQTALLALPVCPGPRLPHPWTLFLPGPRLPHAWTLFIHREGPLHASSQLHSPWIACWGLKEPQVPVATSSPSAPGLEGSSMEAAASVSLVGSVLSGMSSSLPGQVASSPLLLSPQRLQTRAPGLVCRLPGGLPHTVRWGSLCPPSAKSFPAGTLGPGLTVPWDFRSWPHCAAGLAFPKPSPGHL